MSDLVGKVALGIAAGAAAALFGYAVAATTLPKGDDDLQLQRRLGNGHFGEVWKGTFKGEVVAIKMLLDRSAADSDENLKKEADVMRGLKHPNIVSFVGLFDYKGNLAIVMEYLENGSLDTYLSSGQGRGLNARGLVRLIVQVTRGMAYLENKGVVHRDLAARNVLVGRDRVCKVSDFGMTRIVHDDYYFASYGAAIPLRWTAPEAFVERNFTLKSDVWSFGMLCYEVITKGENPFPYEWGNQAVETILRKAYRNPSTFRPEDHLPQTGECPDRLYGVMKLCWTVRKQHRPYISSLISQIERII